MKLKPTSTELIVAAVLALLATAYLCFLSWTGWQGHFQPIHASSLAEVTRLFPRTFVVLFLFCLVGLMWNRRE
jgi:hypothetical protein